MELIDTIFTPKQREKHSQLSNITDRQTDRKKKRKKRRIKNGR